MPEPTNLGIAFGKPPEDVLRYFESKGWNLDHWNWYDTWQGANARAFVIARVARLDVQQEIRERLRETLADGKTERQFIKELRTELQKMGWWGKKVLVDSGGNAEVVQQGSARRLKTIYRTNVNTAYSVGRYTRQVENTDSRPYWMYVAVMDARTRASHAAMNGMVFQSDDPIWDTHYPPNGFNCRCRVRALTQRQVDSRKIAVQSSAGRLQQVTQDVGVDKRTGEVIQRPAWKYTAPDGESMTPSPGWNYSPGRAGYQPDLDRYDYDLARDYVASSLKGPAFALAWRQWETRAEDLRRQEPGISDAVLKARMADEAGRHVHWPVAILDEEGRELLGVRTQVVLLSDETLSKQVVSRYGQGFELEDYWQVQQVIEQATVIVKEGDDVLIFVRQEDVWYHAVVKRTRDRRKLYLTSFRRTTARGLRKAINKGDVVRDER